MPRNRLVSTPASFSIALLALGLTATIPVRFYATHTGATQVARSDEFEEEETEQGTEIDKFPKEKPPGHIKGAAAGYPTGLDSRRADRFWRNYKSPRQPEPKPKKPKQAP